ncbi:MAG: bifunctional diaminohydroxyphosphoribosylaminopyrimidine deaminase/5-amino-6-(5-phosphoribosylamino)uracil reductase RibD, partial [Candidatus Marinamargulisbacteria bacterium]
MLNNLIQRTLELRGTQFPNPSVGAMVIKDGTIISDGYHLVSGERHAEVVALDNAGDQACGATLLITLEPCCHDGKTPPCVDRIIASGVQRVVWAMNDPNPKMQGRAATVLVSHGLDVVAHALPAEAWPAIKEFHTFFDQQRPYIYVKTAMSLDGYIAPNTNGLN